MEILDNKEVEDRFSADIGKDVGGENADEVEDTLVLGAVRSAQKDLVHFVMPDYPDAGTVVDESNGNSTVHYQVLVDDDPEILLMLLARGGEVDVRNMQGRTALNLAETKKRTQSVRLLIRWSNADADERHEMINELQQKSLLSETGSPLRSPIKRGGSQKSEESAEDESFEEQREIDLHELVPEEPRPASRDSSRPGVPGTGKSRAWKMDIDDLLEEPIGYADPAMGSELLAQTMKEISELRAKVEMLEQRQETLLASPNQTGAGGEKYQSQSFDEPQHGAAVPDATHQAARYASDFSRPTTGDTMGAAAIEELFYKMHLMQQKIDQHEIATEQQSQVMTEQQESAIYQINAKMEEITVQQQQAAMMLAETSHKIGSYLQFDKTGAPSQDGKIVLTVRAAHGLLHLDPHHPPSPYAVISIDQQVVMTAVAPDTRNPIWEKECVFDVPSKPSRIIVSVLDRTILGSNRTVLLGKSHISLDLLTDTDMEDWHDLTTDEFGMVRQHAGSVRVKRRFVPTRAWNEYLKNRSYQASLTNMLDDLSVEHSAGNDGNIYGLYIMVLAGEGLSSGVPHQHVMTYLQLDQGTNMAESTKHQLNANITFGKSKDEV